MLQISPLMVTALEGASWTALDSGTIAVPLRTTVDPFRPPRPSRGNLIARARVVHNSQFYVFSEVQVEDHNGRHIAQGSLHSAIRRVEPAPPLPPETLQIVEEPVYETPDPYLRSFPISPYAELFEHENGVTILRRLTDGYLSLPLTTLYGIAYEEVAEGRATLSIPASEWFCLLRNEVSHSTLATIGNISWWMAALSLHRPRQTIVGLDGVIRFLRSVKTDGRRLRAETVAIEPAPNLFILDTKIYDADGHLIVLASGSATRLDTTQRIQRQRKESRRVLSTLFFTDIVDSTGHARRLGDAGWRNLKEQHNLAIRRELSRYNGIEVDTAGDGFFARFDSPAQAIEAARAARLAVAPLGIQIRAGIHTGECELEGSRLTGVAVHIAARIQALAESGEILVSSTVKDLTSGTAIRFMDKGEQNLKGISEPWRVFAVAD
jgi:class 3 adenylate cyclase